MPWVNNVRVSVSGKNKQTLDDLTKLTPEELYAYNRKIGFGFLSIPVFTMPSAKEEADSSFIAHDQNGTVCLEREETSVSYRNCMILRKATCKLGGSSQISITNHGLVVALQSHSWVTSRSRY